MLSFALPFCRFGLPSFDDESHVALPAFRYFDAKARRCGVEVDSGDLLQSLLIRSLYQRTTVRRAAAWGLARAGRNGLERDLICTRRTSKRKRSLLVSRRFCDALVARAVKEDQNPGNATIVVQYFPFNRDPGGLRRRCKFASRACTATEDACDEQQESPAGTKTAHD
jgi:hypothetical protein